ncbi:MAG: YraN family protein [Syntrophomonas sp.]|nr:YraN family protein [Syntrophomonas sp.]
MKKEIGRRGEEMAAQYLKESGYQILCRNFRSRNGEIDIICNRAGAVIFVEVKTRTNTHFGFPEEAVTWTKKGHIRKVALEYLAAFPHPYRELRFDVIGILVEDGVPRINHLEGAF